MVQSKTCFCLQVASLKIASSLSEWRKWDSTPFTTYDASFQRQIQESEWPVSVVHRDIVSNWFMELANSRPYQVQLSWMFLNTHTGCSLRSSSSRATPRLYLYDQPSPRPWSEKDWRVLLDMQQMLLSSLRQAVEFSYLTVGMVRLSVPSACF